MERRVLLVRHGHHAEVGRVLSGRSDIALDARGRAEAMAVAQHLAGTPIDRLFSSPRARTVDTALAFGEQVRVAAALDEVDFGTFTGRTFAALDGDADWRRWNAERGSFRCPGGETMGEAVARAVGFVAALGVGVSVCVTHCDIIRGVVAHYLGLPLDRIFALGCDPGSVTTLMLEGQGARLATLNERPWP
ncbi:histidine phosphatase family protein [Sphingomonas endophytica]|uniref:Phosphoglycerate mutase n=1 Tax=Sphingomonas endophytica TaxID=869719 RepID=A0A147I4L8_9SPHN|nr:histidine phosphatase family protein [Sphingomonas endophytica]KTT73138.1 hypothetical protein NS334_07690 [Sphingomonas endophytica]